MEGETSGPGRPPGTRDRRVCSSPSVMHHCGQGLAYDDGKWLESPWGKGLTWNLAWFLREAPPPPAPPQCRGSTPTPLRIPTSRTFAPSCSQVAWYRRTRAPAGRSPALPGGRAGFDNGVHPGKLSPPECFQRMGMGKRSCQGVPADRSAPPLKLPRGPIRLKFSCAFPCKCPRPPLKSLRESVVSPQGVHARRKVSEGR